VPLPNTTVGKTILVVDDEEINIEVVASILNANGYIVEKAQSGQSCLKAARRSRPDLILLDINMPGMSGIEVCGHLKRDLKTRAIPVIFVTSNTDDEILAAAFDAGCNDYVHKPVNRIELIARINVALLQRTSAQQLAEDEKLKGVLETAGGVCHELNQPLQYILGSIQLMMMEISDTDPLHESLVKVMQQVERIGAITRKLMEITRYKTRLYADGKSILDIEQSSQKDDNP
jgi:CheY-like chemotaxis protein